MIRLTVMATLLLSIVGCATGTGLTTHLDPQASLAEKETFRILPNTLESPASPQAMAAAKREIERAIADTLVEKGYQRVAGETAHLDVEYVMYVTEQYQEGAQDRYVLDDQVHLLTGSESRLGDPIREGTLHIHVLLNGKPVYEAIASDVLESGIPVEKRIRTMVPKMLADFPIR